MSGVTLPELVVALVVIAILATIAIPSLREMYATSELNNAQEDVVGVLKKARAWAVSRGTIVTVLFSNTTTPNTIKLTATDNSLGQTVNLPQSVAVNQTIATTFNPSGTASAIAFTLASTSVPTLPARQVSVTAVGHVNVSR